MRNELRCRTPDELYDNRVLFSQSGLTMYAGSEWFEQFEAEEALVGILAAAELPKATGEESLRMVPRTAIGADKKGGHLAMDATSGGVHRSPSYTLESIGFDSSNLETSMHGEHTIFTINREPLLKI